MALRFMKLNLIKLFLKDADMYNKNLLLIAGLLLSFSLVSAFNWNSGTRVYYSFEESSGNVIDISSHYNSSVLGNITREVEGIFNKGYSFNGSVASYVYNLSYLNITSYPFTYNVWIKTKTFSGGRNIIELNDVSDNDPNWGLVSDTDRLKNSVNNGGGLLNSDYTTASTGNISDDVWHMATVVEMQNNRYVYLDGVPVITFTQSAYPFFLSIGYDNTNLTFYIGKNWNGSIDEAMVFNRSLNQSEILELYNNGSSLPFGYQDTNYSLNISNCNQLQDVNLNLVGHYTLLNDIDCSDTINWNSGDGFIPLSVFNGTFNGNGFDIINLYEYNPAVDNQGLFGITTTDSIIHDVRLINVSIVGSNDVGGLIGTSEGKVYNNYVNGQIFGDVSAGGLIGFVDAGSVNDSYSDANVSVGFDVVGGLIGESDNINIFNCYASGIVNGGQNVAGGLIGSFVNGVLVNSYSTAKVNGVDFVGGLVGDNTSISCVNSYWDIQTSNQTTSVCGIGKTTLQMKKLSTFSNWDIEGTFTNLNNGYPFLSMSSTPKWFIFIPADSIKDPLATTGAGLGIFLVYLSRGLPYLLIPLAFIGIIIAIVLGLKKTIVNVASP